MNTISAIIVFFAMGTLIGVQGFWFPAARKCELKCPYGFEHDVEGTIMCKCRATSKSVASFMEGNLLTFPHEMKCKRNCPYGYERSVEGNVICRCKRPFPPAFGCKMDCPYGYERDGEGNQICRCKKLFPPDLSCGLTCPYGYEHDVEGNKICRCKKPCQYISCSGQLTCVVEMKNNRAVAICKEPKDTITSRKVSEKNNNKKRNKFRRRRICYENLRLEAIKCTDKRTKRWYFDANAGQCKHFRGCPTAGNNFGKKRICKKKCIKRRKSSKVPRWIRDMMTK